MTSEPASEGSEPRNVVLVTIDSLRADHCGFLGADSQLTPTLDELATDAVVFEDAIAPGPRTPSSIPVILTGETPEPADFQYSEWRERRAHLARHMRRHRTLAQRFRANGYSTVGVTVNPWTQEDTGFDEGFDEFLEVNAESEAFDGAIGPPLVRLADAVLERTPLGDRLDWPSRRDWFVRWTDFYDQLLEQLEGVEEPYFLWLFLLDTHQPYLSPRSVREEASALEMYRSNYLELREGGEHLDAGTRASLAESYRDAVRSVDAFVDRLVDDVVAPDDAILALHSDHGEAFAEHGNFGHEPELYRENLHVPFLLHDVGQSARVSEPTSLRELPDLLTEAALAGEAFRPADYAADYETATTEIGKQFAVYDGRWKYIADDADGSVELFDTSADAAETSDLASERSGTLVELDARLRRRRAHEHEKRLLSAGVEAVAGEL